MAFEVGDLLVDKVYEERVIQVVSTPDARGEGNWRVKDMESGKEHEMANTMLKKYYKPYIDEEDDE